MNRKLIQSAGARRAFTLVELLIVIGIISVLIAVLLPALRSARRAAYNAVCLSNLRQIGLAATQYVQDNQGWLLDYNQTNNTSGWVLGTAYANVSAGYPSSLWLDYIMKYSGGKNVGVLECPEQTLVARGTTNFYQVLTNPAAEMRDPTSVTSGYILPRRTYYPGYMQTVFTHTQNNFLYTLNGQSFRRNLKHKQFKHASDKIWYADAGRRWLAPSGPAYESWQPLSSQGLQTGTSTSTNGAMVSWRHGTDAGPRGNILCFDGHAESIDPRGTVFQSIPVPLGERDIFNRYWDPDSDGNYLTPLQ